MSKEQVIRALNLDKDGDWDSAHQIVQVMGSNAANRVHAYLHRKEGDIWNADYWYRRCGEKRPDISLEDEWQMLYKKMTTA